MCGPFTPMLFQGEEWAASTPFQFFTSHPEPELGRATAEGRITEFERQGWDPGVVPDPQDPATFDRSKLDWSEQDSVRGRRMRAVYRRLAALRREHAELTEPSSRGLHGRRGDPGVHDAARRADGAWSTSVSGSDASPSVRASCSSRPSQGSAWWTARSRCRPTPAAWSSRLQECGLQLLEGRPARRSAGASTSACLVEVRERSPVARVLALGLLDLHAGSARRRIRT